MGANPAHQAGALVSGGYAASENDRRQIMFDRGPRGVDPFRTVERVLPGYALSPPRHPVALDIQQQYAAAVKTAEARLEKMDERHLNFTQSDAFNFHVNLEISTSSFHPSGPAGIYHCPADPVHIPAPPNPQKMNLESRSGFGPAPPAHGHAYRVKPSIGKSAP